MNRVPPGLLARLTLAQIEALEDLDHNCDLISRRPSAYDVRWTLERAGVPADLCAAISETAA